jgi:hypothetical protein
MSYSSLKSVSLAFFISFGARAASDQNLLSNGDFGSAEQVTGWNARDGTLTWSSDDASNDETSGSLLLSTGMTGVGHAAEAFGSCFAVVPGSEYAFGGSSRITLGNGTASMTCSTYTDESCSVSRTNLTAASLPTESTWGTGTQSTGILPVDARSARCFLLLNGSGATQSSAIEFDDLSFTSAAPAVPVRLQEFGVN